MNIDRVNLSAVNLLSQLVNIVHLYSREGIEVFDLNMISLKCPASSPSRGCRKTKIIAGSTSSYGFIARFSCARRTLHMKKEFCDTLLKGDDYRNVSIRAMQ